MSCGDLLTVFVLASFAHAIPPFSYVFFFFADERISNTLVRLRENVAANEGATQESRVWQWSAIQTLIIMIYNRHDLSS
jgi:hypothetical protein